MLNVVQSGGDTRFELANHQVGRVLSIGTSWTHLRIGMRIQFDDLGQNPGAVFFGLGVCASPTALFANGPLGTGAHFIGAASASDGSSNWTREAGYAAYHGSTWTSQLAAGVISRTGGGTFRYSASPAHRLAFVIDLEKTTPTNMFIELCSGSGGAGLLEAQILNDLDDIDALIGAMEAGPAMSSVRDFLNAYIGVPNYSMTGHNQTFDEGVNGDLTSICCFWNRRSIPMRISEILWSKIA